MEKVFRELGYTCPIVIAGDHEAALLGGIGRHTGILLIAGTGSICVARDESGREYRCGGFGHIIDDAGSGYALGRDILNAVVRMEDGRGPKTALKDAVFRMLQIETVDQLMDYVYNAQKTKKDVAAVSACLTEDLIRHDEVAGELVHRAVKELVLHVETILSPQYLNYDRLFVTPIPLILAGGVLTNNQEINRLFREQLKERDLPIRIAAKKQDAAYGAALFVEMP